MTSTPTPPASHPAAILLWLGPSSAQNYMLTGLPIGRTGP